MQAPLLAGLAFVACAHEVNAPLSDPTSSSAADPQAMAARVPPRNAVPTDVDADQIAVDIRAPAMDPGSPATLDHWVRGPLVVLDAERGTVTTECGDRANGAAASWGLSLAIPPSPIRRAWCRSIASSASSAGA